MDFGLIPYNFEPEYSEEELRERSIASANDGEGNKTEDADCRCERCIFSIAVVPEERNCCADNTLCITSMSDLTCITEHSSFATIVLAPIILEVAFVQTMAYKRSQSVVPATLTNR